MPTLFAAAAHLAASEASARRAYWLPATAPTAACVTLAASPATSSAVIPADTATYTPPTAAALNTAIRASADSYPFVVAIAAALNTTAAPTATSQLASPSPTITSLDHAFAPSTALDAAIRSATTSRITAVVTTHR